MINHDGTGPAPFRNDWDPSDVEYVWIAWDDILRGATISDSSWTVPTGWTVEAEQMNAAVTDDDGNSYSAANGALLSTTATKGRHVFTNHVVLSDGREYERSVAVSVRQM